MGKPKIIVHCMVKNEENFVWYTLSSVLPFVDKIMLWDNNSTDNTVRIIKTIRSPKIIFEEHNAKTREEVGRLRQEMLERTPKGYDWVLVLDADEIWSAEAIKKVIDYITTNPSVESIVTRTYNLVGDIYHRLPEKFGDYTFLDMKGNLAIRFINLSIPGLHASSPYGQEGYFDENNLPIQERSGVAYVDTEYFHATHLLRSSKNKEVFDRTRKLKHYLGEKISPEKIPKVFFIQRPSIVPNITSPMGNLQITKAIFETQLRNIKNTLFKK